MFTCTCTPPQEGAAARQQFKANDPAIWLAPAILGLPFFMPLLVMVFEFVGASWFRVMWNYMVRMKVVNTQP